MKKFKTLYKKSNKNKIEQWNIEVETTEDYPDIVITFGEQDGKKQIKRQTITEGKNVGKKNETTIIEQAYAEAQARWEKQLKKGYVQNLKDAEAGLTDEIIQGGIIPMLAHKFQDYDYLIEYPVMVQPKLDGQRCVAIKQNGTVTLWTRTRKPILSCPHIIEQLEETLKGMDNFFLDGELYLHEKDNFEKIMSAVRKQKSSPESRNIQFHVYDCEFLGTKTQKFEDRIRLLLKLKIKSKHVMVVKTFSCPTLQSVQDMQKLFIEQGYEGLMLRQASGVYECKRSTSLLKMKTFDDAEFEIVDFVAGEDQSVVAVCKLDDNKTFGATMSGDKKNNQKYLQDKKSYVGKKLTVKFQGLSGYGVPRFPVGLRIRGEE